MQISNISQDQNNKLASTNSHYANVNAHKISKGLFKKA